MTRIILPREEAAVVQHPLHLHGCLRVDHPMVDDLQLGRGDWEGDARLALYANVKRDTFDLWRLEHDGKYRLAARSPRGERLGDQTFWKLARGLQMRDIRRGFDVVAALDAHEEALERAQDKEDSDFNQDFADRFAHALKRDGALDYC